MKTEFSITFEAKVEYDEAAKVHVYFAPALDIVTQAETKDEALNALVDAVQQHVRIAYKHGMLEELLKGWGVQPSVAPRVTRISESNQSADTIRTPVLSAP